MYKKKKEDAYHNIWWWYRQSQKEQQLWCNILMQLLYWVCIYIYNKYDVWWQIYIRLLFEILWFLRRHEKVREVELAKHFCNENKWFVTCTCFIYLCISGHASKYHSICFHFSSMVMGNFGFEFLLAALNLV